MSVASVSNAATSLAGRFKTMRSRTLALCNTLTAEDMMVQSCAEASPAKWHLAHTAWFFESFILREFLPGYRLFNDEFPWLFNSYYQTFAAFPEKRLRSSFSRPGLDQILRYRKHVDQAIEKLLEQSPDPEALKRIELGVNHEEQHQELLLTDIHHAFFTNPLRPAYRPGSPEPDAPGLSAPVPAVSLAKAWPEPVEGGLDSETRESTTQPIPNDANVPADGKLPSLRFHSFPGGLREFGSDGLGFCFDNERPRHRVWLEPYRLSNRLVTCSEFAAFMADGGYSRPELWLSAGWDAVKARGWRAPLYWTEAEGAWSIFTLRGELPLARLRHAPVSHISYFEADAYARWARHRLPTEFEWEAAAETQTVTGNLLDSGLLLPSPAPSSPQSQDPTEPSEGPRQLFGDCWEWTASAYLGYPGFEPLGGALGEYNGKFMSGQMVLRGGSCATPAAHIRASYRNFFPPETRWQFSGIRLAS